MTFRRDLLPHPADDPGGITAIRGGVERKGPLLVFSFALAGDVTGLRIPLSRTRQRTEGLWHHTCFEAFLRRPGQEDYLEFNFAPFGPWAAYRFDGYRSGRRALRVAAPFVAGMMHGTVLSLFASVEQPPRAWEIGLSAVVEDSEGRISHWALAHPSAKPDFHHPDSFTLQFPGPRT